MLHQSVELGYRGLLEALNGCCKKTHELRQLRDQCLPCAPELSGLFPDDPGEERRLLDILEAAYSGARYDSRSTVHDSDMDLLTERVGDFPAAAAYVFQEELAGYDPPAKEESKAGCVCVDGIRDRPLIGMSVLAPARGRSGA